MLSPLFPKKRYPVKKALRDALNDRNYTDLTPVQKAVLDPELEGSDLLVSAQTGSGKTVGFGLAIAPVLLGEKDQFERAGAPLGLIIAPTRELALQVKREFEWLFAKAGATIASCVGGMDMRDERRSLARGAHIVAATPGRLRDHIMRGSIDLTHLRSIVLDEADEMLDLGFREDLEFILGESPKDRQTLLFSATVPKSITRLAENYQRNAARVIAKSEAQQHSDIRYHAMNVADQDAQNAVINTLLYYDAPNAIVFANTRAMVNRLTTRLSNRGFKVVSLSGELSQAERTQALQSMRDGRAQVCVATDVAARGIDLPNLDLVVHAELPSNHETLLHRSGRTGRAGRKGVSALVVTKRTRKKAERILGMAKVKADWADAPSAEMVNDRDAQSMFADQTWQNPIQDGEAQPVKKLVSTFSPEQLAAGYLRLYRTLRSAPEELADSNSKPTPRREFGPSIWFSITGGRAAGAEPRRILPMICKVADLTKDDVGAIRVKEEHSFVQIQEDKVAGFLEAIGPGLEIEPGATVVQLSAPPSFETSKPPAKQQKTNHKPGKPQHGNSTPPTDWNDDPAPRRRKPKPADRKPKKGRKEGDGGPESVKRVSPVDEGAVIPYKSRTKSKGPKPPIGKSSSKKNKARALTSKADPTGKPPKRRKPKS